MRPDRARPGPSARTVAVQNGAEPEPSHLGSYKEFCQLTIGPDGAVREGPPHTPSPSLRRPPALVLNAGLRRPYAPG